MPRRTQPLVNTEIKSAKPKDKEYSLSDGGGLSLRIKPIGSKTWIFNYYRPFTKKRANISFGQYPEVPLKEARSARDRARELLAKDIDPKRERDRLAKEQAAALMNTFEAVTQQWFELKKGKVTQAHGDSIMRSLRLHAFPKLGKLPVHEITPEEAISALKPLAKQEKLETVRKLCRRINEVMIYALNVGLIETNKLSGIRQAFNPPKVQNMPTLKPEELPELMARLSKAKIKMVTRCLIEWQLHTMVRPNEAAATRWDEIDFDKALWSIPAERMKRNRPHTVPLTKQALDILEEVKQYSGHREYVFPADRKPKEHAHTQTANMALKRMGFARRLVSHGLRALASTTLNEQGFDPDVIEAALAHADNNQVRAAYNRAEYIDRRRAMMDWWSEHITNAEPSNMSQAK